VVLRNRWLGLLVVLVLAVGTACSGSGDQASEEETGAAGDIPEVVAEVNGEEISRDEFDQAYEAQQQQVQAQQQEGQPEPDEEQLRDQVVQGLVTQELVLQEVERRGIQPSEEQVEQTLADLARQNGLPSADAFRTALEEQGMDSEEIDTQLERQTAYDLLIQDEAGDVSATDQEVRALYQQFKQQQAGAGDQAQEVPPLKKIRGEVEAQVESQKESQAAQELIQQLRDDADITVNL
jgi:parvulin-like peptidyl-prolyl isomerase